jgi:hypothetical protein
MGMNLVQANLRCDVFEGAVVKVPVELESLDR